MSRQILLQQPAFDHTAVQHARAGRSFPSSMISRAMMSHILLRLPNLDSPWWVPCFLLGTCTRRCTPIDRHAGRNRGHRQQAPKRAKGHEQQKSQTILHFLACTLHYNLSAHIRNAPILSERIPSLSCARVRAWAEALYHPNIDSISDEA